MWIKRKSNKKTITTKAASQILRKYKDRFPEWHDLSLANSIIEITDKHVQIAHVEKGVLKKDVFLDFSKDQDWATQLSEFFKDRK